MSNTHLSKWVWVVVAAAALVVATISLRASPLSLMASKSPAASVSSSTSSCSKAAVISWSVPSFDTDLAPGASSTRSLTVMSNVLLEHVNFEPGPEIASFVTIQPSNFVRMAPSQAVPIAITVSIPTSTGLGTYQGTIHARVGTSTLPQTLKITINVWRSLTDTQVGLSISYPPSLYNLTDSNSATNSFDLESSPNGVAIGGAVPSGSDVAKSGFAIGIDVTPYEITGGFDLTEYLASNYPNSAADASATPITVGGEPGYEIFFKGEQIGNWPVAVVYQNGYVYRFLYSSTDYNSGFSDQSGFNAFNAVLAHATFSQ